MKESTTSIFLVFVLCGISTAQGTTNPGASPQNPTPASPSSSTSAQPVKNTRIAPGSVFPAQLTKGIDAKKAKTGDEIDAQVTEDLKSNSGEIIVPKNTKIIGRVTEAQAHSKEQKESQVGISFDHAVMKNGDDVPMPMSIQAVIAPSYLTGGNGPSTEGTAQPSSTPDATGTGPGNDRAGSMGAPQSQKPSASAEDGPTTPPSNNARQPITGNTQGVLGIPNLSLSPTADSTHGSVITSEKNNVKLEGGTLLLLRVNQ